MLQSLAGLQRQLNSGHQLAKVEGSRRSSHDKNEKLNPRKKGFKPSHLLKQQRKLSQDVIDMTRVMRKNPKEPLKCWGCEEPHLWGYFPLENRKEGQVPSTQEAKIVGQETGIIPKICALLEDHQEGHNSTVVEVEGEIVKQAVFVLIDPGSTHSYITPRIIEMCTLKKSRHKRSWLVQLATGIKKKVSEVVMKCPLVMDGLVT